MTSISLQRFLVWILAMIVTIGLLLAIVPVVEHVVRWRAIMAEHTTIQGTVDGWRDRPPRGVAEADWKSACEALQIAVKNAFNPNQVSLEEARAFRAEVEQRDKEPVTADTLEWFLLRLGDTSPVAADYIARHEWWLRDALSAVRARSGTEAP